MEFVWFHGENFLPWYYGIMPFKDFMYDPDDLKHLNMSKHFCCFNSWSHYQMSVTLYLITSVAGITCSFFTT